MIDTLKLNLIDCEISDKSPLIVEPSPYIHDSEQRFVDYDLFVDTAGVITTGKKAYYNHDKFNLTITPKFSIKQDAKEKKLILDMRTIAGLKVGRVQDVSIKEQSWNSGVFVQTSLPRYLNTTNFDSITVDQEKKVLKKLETDLKGIGIKTNIWNSQLSRVDAFTNIVTDENFYSYSNLFEVLEAARMQRFEYAKTTFLFKNGERQICVYDKPAEMKAKLRRPELYSEIKNVMRIETRYIKKRKILNAFKFTSLGDLYKNYDYIKENHRKEVNETLFKYKVNEVERLTGNFIKEDLQYFYNTGSRQWLNNYLKMFGVAQLMKLSDLETIIEKVFEIIESDSNRQPKNKRMIKSRIKTMFQNLQFRLTCSQIDLHSTKTNRTLYKELRQKFHKLAA